MLKREIREILGRRIVGVVVKEASKDPRSQVFLVFDDETYYEFYGDAIRGTGGVNRGGYEAVLAYMRHELRDPVFAAIAEPAGQQAADREIALGWIRAHLRGNEIDLHELQLALGRVMKAGLDWKPLYAEALAVRPPGGAAPPTTEALIPEWP